MMFRYSPFMHVIASGCGKSHMYLVHKRWVGCPLRLTDALSTFIGQCGGRLKNIHAGTLNHR